MQPVSIYSGLLIALTIALARTLLLQLQNYQKARKWGCQPVKKYPHTRPFGWDLYRARLEALRSGRRNDFDHELFQTYGSTYQETSGTGIIIHSSDPVNLQAVGANQFDDFGKEPRPAVEALFGSGILSVNGAEWRQARDLINPLFKRAELNDMGSFSRHVDTMLSLIPRDGSTIDMQPLLQKLFLDTSTEFIFGESINSMRDTTGQADSFRDAFNQALAGAGRRLNPGASFAFLSSRDKLWDAQCAGINTFIDDRISRFRGAATSLPQTPSSRRKPYVLLEGMSAAFPDPIQLRYQLFNVFFPARDTTAIAVSNALFDLARNPSVWAHLRRQALELPREEELTFEKLKGLADFRYVLFEAIRLHGPSGQKRRVALRDTTLPRGGGPVADAPVFVAAGAAVYLNDVPNMRDPKIWGNDVDVFRPDRFRGRKLAGWEFTPFFGGPRICPAVNLVVAQGVYVLVRLAREFREMENRDPCVEYVQSARMLVESGNGVQVAFHSG